MKRDAAIATRISFRSARSGIASTILTALTLLSCAYWLPAAQGTQEKPPAKPDTARETRSADPSERTPQPVVVVASSDDYRIGKSDVLEVKVFDAPELSGLYVVSSNGEIPMSFVGDIQVLNKTPLEVAKTIENGLRGDYLKEPRVTVTVTQYNSRSFFIQGSVRAPGVYRVMGRVSLFALITAAGGMTDNHGSTAFIIRRVRKEGDSGGSPEVIDEFELKQANVNKLDKGDFSENIVVEPGDLINIPKADVFFVGGEVRKQGEFSLKEGTTLTQAILLAQGTNFEAALSKGVIMREDKEGRRQDIKVNIDDVMKRKAPDPVIQANDIILVPNSRGKQIGGAVLKALGVGAVNRAIYTTY
jgi:polysaccharide export outer membrane protein